ncbi:hypothetical protein [Streptomyces katsurahamanus]|nr:hypothetical protein [Streptomyces katsurahamanus]
MLAWGTDGAAVMPMDTVLSKPLTPTPAQHQHLGAVVKQVKENSMIT